MRVIVTERRRVSLPNLLSLTPRGSTTTTKPLLATTTSSTSTTTSSSSMATPTPSSLSSSLSSVSITTALMGKRQLEREELIVRTARLTEAVLEEPEDEGPGFVRVPAGLTTGGMVRAVVETTSSSESHVVTALALLLKIRRTGREVSSRNIGRLFVTAMVIAWKLLEDAAPYCSMWASAFDWFSTEDLVTMEREFCTCINWDVVIHVKDFDSIDASLRNLQL
jgi:hypothetical protein